VKGAAGRQSWVAHYKLAVFRVGDVALAPFPVQVRKDSLVATASTDSIRLYVTTVLDDSLAAADLRDIKPQVKLPVSRWPWIVGGAALLAALVAYLWWRRRRRPRAAVVALPRARPAHEQALEALRRLESQRLPLDGKFGEHHVRLSEILRRYLEDGFAVPALEETTEEILFELDRRNFDRATLKQVGSMCAESDLVKFAKHEPTVEECVRSLERVREFVIATAARTSSAHPGEPAGPLAIAGLAGVAVTAEREVEGKSA
jgi:C4-dicarboxylate-specific signal transduction histidine kinase